jgi:hypothetical protein
MKRYAVIAAVCALACASGQDEPVRQKIAENLTANALKADVSFLASDLLQGRATPSAGLDLAAEYIAAQFRRAGLEPPSDDGYFQTAHYSVVTPRLEGFVFQLENGADATRVERTAVLIDQPGPVSLNHAKAVKLTAENLAAWAGKLSGRVVFLEVPNLAAVPARDREKAAAAFIQLRVQAMGEKPALMVYLDERSRPGTAAQRLREDSAESLPPALRIAGGPAGKLIADAKPGSLPMTVTARIPAPSAAPALVRNVIGVLRGSDPELKNTYVVVSAHYDHLGVRTAGSGDRIFNGANDDASGTASVIEMANAFAKLPEKPKRSILFMAFFGEERGLLGSHYYVAHPIFPLAQTVTDINIEQTGRIDDQTGEHPLQFNETGHDYTNLAAVFEKAAESSGVHLVKDARYTEPFFSQSDNLSFASAGIPCTTVSVTYEFPDAHMPGDEWQKLDYENMARVDDAIAWGIWMIAEDAQPPAWNLENAAAAAYARERKPN